MTSPTKGGEWGDSEVGSIGFGPGAGGSREEGCGGALEVGEGMGSWRGSRDGREVGGKWGWGFGGSGGAEEECVSGAAEATKVINSEGEDDEARGVCSFDDGGARDTGASVSFEFLQSAIKMGLC